MKKINTKIIETFITEEEIMQHYLKPYNGGRKLSYGVCIRSPFRQDRNPSFNIYMSRKGVRYKDFGDEGIHGNCYDLVMRLFCLTFQEALEKIASDFNLFIE